MAGGNLVACVVLSRCWGVFPGYFIVASRISELTCMVLIQALSVSLCVLFARFFVILIDSLLLNLNLNL